MSRHTRRTRTETPHDRCDGGRDGGLFSWSAGSPPLPRLVALVVLWRPTVGPRGFSPAWASEPTIGWWTEPRRWSHCLVLFSEVVATETRRHTKHPSSQPPRLPRPSTRSSVRRTPYYRPFASRPWGPQACWIPAPTGTTNRPEVPRTGPDQVESVQLGPGSKGRTLRSRAASTTRGGGHRTGTR